MSEPDAPRLPALLLVDDEPAWLEVMQEAMDGQFELTTATSAKQAAKLMSAQAYDIVVCDHLMPGEVGLDFLLQVQRRYPQTKRILLTGYMNPELIIRSVKVAGLSACLLKPMSPHELIKAVEVALR